MNSLLLAALAACYPPTGPQPAIQPAPAAQPTAGPQPADRWSELLQRTPWPYSTPLPPAVHSPIDGTYTKVNLRTDEHVHCLRCPDYLPEGGVWKLSLDNGIFRIYYPTTGWRSLASFALDGDRMTLFNDPNCTDVVGSYRWKLDGQQLILTEIEDECAIRLRAANLTELPWQSCQPPNAEAAITDHWQKPPGC